MEKRIVKVPMDANLIRRMDEALTINRGGLETREQFISEAAEGLLAELSYPQAPPEPAAGRASTSVSEGSSGGAPNFPAGVLASVPSWEQDELRFADLAGSALGPIQVGSTLSAGVAAPIGEPMLGLHNRDFPSLWAAARLARYSMESLIAVTEFWSRVTAAAWFYGAQLHSFEQSGGLRLTPIFPTNPEKREAAEQGFQVFGLGEIPRRLSGEEEIPVSGPLFDWRICQLERRDGEMIIGLTPVGQSLLGRMAGLSLVLPHEQAQAEVFLRHLYEHAEGERWGFETVLTATAGEPSREELVATFAENKGDWTKATASSVAQGYVARAREWGLVEPRLQAGRYRLTSFGEHWQRGSTAIGDGDKGR